MLLLLLMMMMMMMTVTVTVMMMMMMTMMILVGHSPMIIEVPHFASLRGEEREIALLRSDDGHSWRQHEPPATEDAVHEILESHFEGVPQPYLPNCVISISLRQFTNFIFANVEILNALEITYYNSRF